VRNDKEAAFSLRRANKSYREIKEELGVSLGNLSEWFSGEEWSVLVGKNLSARRVIRSKIKITELNLTRGAKLVEAYERARTEAEREFLILREDPLFIAGLVAYWSQGDRTSKSNVQISNIDPGILLLFKRFLTYICNIPENKLTCRLLLYPTLDDEASRAYWSGKTGIPLSNFRKSMYLIGRQRPKRQSYGVCSLTVSSRYLKEKMLLWLRLLAEESANAVIV
jgi:hypothetical protein